MKILTDLLSFYMYKYCVYYILVCISLSFLFPDPYKQLDVDFLKNKKKSVQVKNSPTKKKKEELPKYTDLIKDYEKSQFR